MFHYFRSKSRLLEKKVLFTVPKVKSIQSLLAVLYLETQSSWISYKITYLLRLDRKFVLNSETDKLDY